MATKFEEMAVVVSQKEIATDIYDLTIQTKEIAAAAKAQIDLELDKKKMQLSDPIKALGTYEIPVKLHQKVTTKLTVQVVEG